MSELKVCRTVTTVIALALVLAVAASAATPAAASGTVKENITVKLYPDNSARLVGYVTIDCRPNVTGVAELNVTQQASGSVAALHVNMTFVNASKLMAKEGGAAKQEAMVSFFKNLELSASGNATLLDSKYVGRVAGNFNLELSISSNGNKLKLKILTLKPLVLTRYVKEMLTTYEGVVKVEYSGSNTAALALMFSLLNKKFVENKLRQSNITWIKIKELNTTTTPSSSVIRFSIAINESAMIKSMAKNNATIAEGLEKVLRKPLTPMKAHVSFNIRLYKSNVLADLKMDSNLTVTEMVEAMVNNTLSNLKQFSMKGAATQQIGGHRISMKEALALIANASRILNKFEILPSTGFIKLVARKNGITITFETLKFRAKGAKSPEDTLRELVSSVKELRDLLGVSGVGKAGVEGKAVKALDAVLKGNVSVVEANSTAPPKVVPFNELMNYTLSTTTAATSTTTTAATTASPSSTSATTPTPATSTSSTTTATQATTSSTATTTSTRTTQPATSTHTSTATSTASTASTTTQATSTGSVASTSTSSAASSTQASPSPSSTTARSAWGGTRIAVVAGIIIAVAVVISVAVSVARRRRV